MGCDADKLPGSIIKHFDNSIRINDNNTIVGRTDKRLNFITGPTHLCIEYPHEVLAAYDTH
ncbi:hypothetical protein SDC9_111083 [bioreactor metagenome]|uniref:Uncharacterized protein n=1 Tax=bioreactor metagenome TaxID=1076179 RepID=A0A645BFT2_9ZZZZ